MAGAEFWGHSVIHINYFMGGLRIFFLFWRGHIDWSITNFFWGTLGTPNKSTSLDSQLQNRKKCAPYGPPFQFIYMRVELWAKHACDIKVRCYCEQLGNLENLMGTDREDDGNKGKKQKNLPPTFFPERKKLGPSWIHAEPFIACMKLLFPKVFATIFDLHKNPFQELGYHLRFILNQSWADSQLFFPKVPYWLTHQSRVFGTLGMFSPIEALFWTPPPTQFLIRNKCSPDSYLFSLYTWELNFGQTVWDKTQVLLGTSWGIHLRTFWELDGNKGKNKNPPPPSPPWTHHQFRFSK